MNRYEKESFQDKMIPYWREDYYYYRTASDFQYAKDIRIFNMQKPIEEKQKRLGEILYRNMKRLQNRWIAVYGGEGFIGLLQEAVMYAWLVYAVLNKGMSVADFTLYIGSIRSFNGAVGKLLERWTPVDAYGQGQPSDL